MSLNAIETADDIESAQRARALREVSRGARALSPSDELASSNNRGGKIVRKKMEFVADCPSVEQLAGAYYMQVVDVSDLNATWSTVEKALESLPSTDFAPVQGQKSAHSIQYHRDGFMMARSRLCQLEEQDENAVFLEVAKLNGNGFIFQDQFVERLQATLQDGFKALEQLEKPTDLEEEQTSNLAFLDLRGETVGYPMIEKWLTSLQPKKGVQYDQMVVLEALSSLAWNLNDADNFGVLSQYSDDIVERVLNILKVEETTAIPTGYFAAKVLEKFFSDASAVPDKLKEWNTVSSLVQSLIKWSTPNPRALHKEIPCSRGVFTTLLSVVPKAASMMTGEPDAAILKKSEKLVNELDNRMASISALWPADCDMDTLCQALRVTCPVQGEEEVQSA